MTDQNFKVKSLRVNDLGSISNFLCEIFVKNFARRKSPNNKEPRFALKKHLEFQIKSELTVLRRRWGRGVGLISRGTVNGLNSAIYFRFCFVFFEKFGLGRTLSCNFPYQIKNR